MVSPNNHLHVRFAPNRYREVAARRTVETVQKRLSSSAKPSSAGGTGGCLRMDAPDFAVAQAGLRIQSSICKTGSW
jgi:hypothetical protein